MPVRAPLSTLSKLIFAVLAAAILAVALFLWMRSWHPSDADYPQQGVDVNHALGKVDWAAVKADGGDFAYIEATYGDGDRDASFAENWQASVAAGLTRGALHRFHMCRLARDQATNFIATVPREADELPAALDLQLDVGCTARPARAVLLAELASFIQMVEAHTEKPVMIRLSRSFDEEYGVSRAINRPLWLTSRLLTPSYGDRPWVMWRANPARSVDGISAPTGWSVVRP
jgi:lysozyme